MNCPTALWLVGLLLLPAHAGWTAMFPRARKMKACCCGMRAGPCVGMDTACSSSLVATHLAARGLLDGETTAALSAGINLMLVSSNPLCSPDS